MLLHFTGPPVLTTARMHSTPQRFSRRGIYRLPSCDWFSLRLVLLFLGIQQQGAPRRGARRRRAGRRRVGGRAGEREGSQRPRLPGGGGNHPREALARAAVRAAAGGTNRKIVSTSYEPNEAH
eukprot:8679043-Pyramimonas_sp.AAC.2